MTGKHSLSPVKEEGSLQEVLVFVHGFQTTFHSSLKGALRLARALSFRGSVVLYSWPSGDNWAAYQLATDNLEQEVMPLWALLQELEGRSINLLIVAHSMGARMVVRALSEGRECLRRPHRLLLAAPDMRQARFAQQLDTVVTTSPVVACVLVSGCDWALKCSVPGNFCIERFVLSARAGSSASSLCLGDFTTVECTSAQCDRDDVFCHSYVFSCPRVAKDAQAFFGGASANARVNGLGRTLVTCRLFRRRNSSIFWGWQKCRALADQQLMQ